MMMKKVTGNNKIHRLRCINKYESEYNMILKYFWSHLASHLAEYFNALGIHKHRGRKIIKGMI